MSTYYVCIMHHAENCMAAECEKKFNEPYELIKQLKEALADEINAMRPILIAAHNLTRSGWPASYIANYEALCEALRRLGEQSRFRRPGLV